MNAIIILILLTIFVAPNSNAGILDWFFKKNNKIKIVDLKQDNAKPLTWLSDNTIVIGKQASIYLFDIKREALLEKVADSYDVSNQQSTNCFTSDASVFSVRPHIGIGKDGNIFTKESIRYIVDWQQPSKNKYIEFPVVWGINQLDCTIYNYKCQGHRVKS